MFDQKSAIVQKLSIHVVTPMEWSHVGIYIRSMSAPALILTFLMMPRDTAQVLALILMFLMIPTDTARVPNDHNKRFEDIPL